MWIYYNASYYERQGRILILRSLGKKRMIRDFNGFGKIAIENYERLSTGKITEHL